MLRKSNRAAEFGTSSLNMLAVIAHAADNFLQVSMIFVHNVNLESRVRSDMNKTMTGIVYSRYCRGRRQCDRKNEDHNRDHVQLSC